MGQVLIRGVDDGVIQSLKKRAAEHGRSLEAELRVVLAEAVRKPRAALIAELAEIRAMTPKKASDASHRAAEDFVREGRDER